MLPFQQDKKVSRFFIRDQVNLLIYTKIWFHVKAKICLFRSMYKIFWKYTLMPGPLTHVFATTPLILGKRRLNIFTLFISNLFPDILGYLVSPILIYVFKLRGPNLKWFFTFFDQTILGGLVSSVLLICLILLIIRFFPKIAFPFKWKQNFSTKSIIVSVFLGIGLHIILDKFS